jgi:ABC-2 type transport system ATP-binding protein
VLVLDEPTIGLDPNQIRQVRELIVELGKERTIILSSHILPEVEAACTRVLIIDKGRIVGQGRPDELRAGLEGGAATVAVEVLDPGGAARAALEGIAGVRQVVPLEPPAPGLAAFTLEADPGPELRARIFDAAVAGGFKLTGLQSKSVSLEDVFVQITTTEEGAP